MGVKILELFVLISDKLRGDIFLEIFDVTY